MEFVEILPFTPANRNNLIGWIGGRSDGAHYGTSVVYNFPKNKLVDGPLQIEARIDQNAQLSGQLTLWNQQGSHVRRGTLLVIPTGRALLVRRAHLPAGGAKPDAGAAPGSARAARPAGVWIYLRGGAGSAVWRGRLILDCGGTAADRGAIDRHCIPVHYGPNPTIAEAAKDLADYQRLTAEGKLGEAGQKLEELKRAIDKLNTRH